MGVEFKKLTVEESTKLAKQLRNNAETGAPIKMDLLDTSFVLSDREIEEDLINAIHSVPCHY